MAVVAAFIFLGGCFAGRAMALAYPVRRAPCVAVLRTLPPSLRWTPSPPSLATLFRVASLASAHHTDSSRNARAPPDHSRPSRRTKG